MAVDTRIPMERSSTGGAAGKAQGTGSRLVRVLLADDHKMFRDGIAGVLASSYAKEVEVVGQTDTGEEAVVLARKERPDVVVMEVDEKLEKAKDTLSQILLVDSTTPPKVIILTMFENPRILREAIKLGPNTFVHKSASVEELLSAMRTTVGDPTGENVVMVMPQGALQESEDGSGEDVLTKRELEVVVLATLRKALDGEDLRLLVLLFKPSPPPPRPPCLDFLARVVGPGVVLVRLPPE